MKNKHNIVLKEITDELELSLVTCIRPGISEQTVGIKRDAQAVPAVRCIFSVSNSRYFTLLKYHQK